MVGFQPIGDGVWGILPGLGCGISRPTQADLMPGFEAVPHHWVGWEDRGRKESQGADTKREYNGWMGFQLTHPMPTPIIQGIED